MPRLRPPRPAGPGAAGRVRWSSGRAANAAPRLTALAAVFVLVLGLTAAPVPARAAEQRSLWISPEELARLPTSGPEWEAMKSEADGNYDAAKLTERNRHNTQVLAAALVGARLDNDQYRARVRDELASVMSSSVDDGDVLAAVRRLGTYVIAADVIDLHSFDPGFDQDFRSWLADAVTHKYSGGGGGGSVISVHERRPNNFGTHAAASRIAVAAYLGDDEELDRAAAVFAGWLGERGTYSGFDFGDLSWQADSGAPVGINPLGATLNGHDVDGVLPDDQRRAGGFSWPPDNENYTWEALQGATVAAELLDRQGYDAWHWGDDALWRATDWLHRVNDFPAEGDDAWQPYLINAAYGSHFPEHGVGAQGKNMAWTDWTYGAAGGGGAREGERTFPLAAPPREEDRGGDAEDADREPRRERDAGEDRRRASAGGREEREDRSGIRALSGGSFAVEATAETDPVPHSSDAADDPAIWVDPTDPGRSLVIGTDKDGGVAVYDLDGRELNFYEAGEPNNVDLRDGFKLGGEEVTLVAVSDKTRGLLVYALDPDRGGLDLLGVLEAPGVYGLCMYRSDTGHYAIATTEEGRAIQWRLREAPEGGLLAERVRELNVGSKSEGCAGDDERGDLYIAEEEGTLWRYGAEPEAGDQRVAIDSTQGDGTLVADIEGIAIAYGENGDGYLVVSSQGSNEYVLYDRAGDQEQLGRFKIADGALDGTDDTDGIDVTTTPLGGDYPQGMLVVQDGTNDGGNQNYKFVPWDLVLDGMRG